MSPSMGSFLQDLRYAVRVLRKSPAFTAVAVLTLALGIGANTAVFSLLDALLLRPLPVHSPEQLVTLVGRGRLNPSYQPLTYPMFERLRREQRVFSNLFGWSIGGIIDLSINGAMLPGSYTAVSSQFFPTLGINPVLGRGFTDDDDRVGAPPVVVLGYQCWQRRFAGDPQVVGKTLKIQDVTFTVIGVAPKSFFGMWVGLAQDVYLPLATEPLFTLGGDFASRKTPWLMATARLQPGITMQQAEAQLATLWPALVSEASAQVPENQRGLFAPSLTLESGATGFSPALRARFTRPLYLLMGMVGLVLLIACVNLATLVLARSAARGHEMAVRIAVGGGAWRIVRQVLTEALLLAFAGALSGVLLALWASHVLARFVWTGWIPLFLDLGPDLRVLGFTTAATLLTAILFGLVPAWRATRHDPGGLLRVGTRAASSTGRMGKVLVAVQLLISMLLLAASGSVLSRLLELRSLDLGFEPSHVALFFLLNRPGAYRQMDHWTYDRQLLDTVAAVPGVESVSLSASSPFPADQFDRTWGLGEAGTPPSAPTVETTKFFVAPGYFRTLGIPLEQGRDFNWLDQPGPPYKAIITRDLAQQLFPDGALGRRIFQRSDPQKTEFEIIGVVANSRLGGLRTQYPHEFSDVFQQPENITQPLLIVRTAGDPRSLFAPVTRAIESLGKEFPLRTYTLQHAIDDVLLPERTMSILAAFFGLLALLLAVIGLYGLMSYNVSQRTAEIGVRVALGADRRKVLSLILREAGLLVAIGVALGIPAAWGLMRLLPRLVEGLSTGWAPVAVSAAVLVVAGIAAAALPARRASRVDPIISLRCE